MEEDGASTVAQPTANAAANTDVGAVGVEPISEDDVPQGHGLPDGRQTVDIDPMALEVLEDMFQKGAVSKSCKQGIFDMEEACARVLPLTLRPGRYRIASWVSGRLKRQKNESDATGRTEKEPWRGTDAYRQQTAAATLPHLNGRDCVGTDDRQAERHFRLKYRGIKLHRVVKAHAGGGERTEQRRVTDVEFENGGWVVLTEVEPAVPGSAPLKVKVTAVGKMIKAYNTATYVKAPSPSPPEPEPASE